jgi:hypothetical protein
MNSNTIPLQRFHGAGGLGRAVRTIPPLPTGAGAASGPGVRPTPKDVDSFDSLAEAIAAVVEHATVTRGTQF